MANGTFHSLLGGDVRITPVMFTLHFLSLPRVWPSLLSVSERC